MFERILMKLLILLSLQLLLLIVPVWGHCFSISCSGWCITLFVIIIDIHCTVLYHIVHWYALYCTAWYHIVHWYALYGTILSIGIHCEMHCEFHYALGGNHLFVILCYTNRYIHCIVLYCMVSYCQLVYIVLYCTVLYCILHWYAL